MKTISIPEELHQKIVTLKMQEGAKNAAELIDKLIIEYKKQKFHEASKLFRQKMEEKGITLADLLKKSRKIREEIADEWYPE